MTNKEKFFSGHEFRLAGLINELYIYQFYTSELTKIKGIHRRSFYESTDPINYVYVANVDLKESTDTYFLAYSAFLVKQHEEIISFDDLTFLETTPKEKFMSGIRFKLAQTPGDSTFFYGGDFIYREDKQSPIGYSKKYEVISITSSGFVFYPDMFAMPKRLTVLFKNLTYLDDIIDRR